MAQYPAIYTDKTGRVITSIHNVFAEKGKECLEMVVDGIPFIGSSFDSFELKFPEKYTSEQLKRFTFNKIPIQGINEFVWELSNCRINFHIPQIVINTEKEMEQLADLHVIVNLGKPSANGGIGKLKAQFIFSVDKDKFESESDNFDVAFAQIQKEMLPTYWLKNCYGCHYSDYSPAGNGFFGDLMCFRNNKAAYLTAAKKEDFFKLALEGFIAVQETYCCSQFAHREKGTGYRGWPFDEIASVKPE